VARTGEQSHRRKGARAEVEARVAAEAWGYRVVAVNHTVKGGEVDIIAWQGEVLCFLEVKHRSNNAFGTALEAVTPRKAARVAVAAQRWLVDHPVDAPVRFDVLFRDGDGGAWQLITDAFRPEAS
jgi:putative endonuclease